MIHLPSPYPGELLYSVIARYGNQIGGGLPAGFAARLFGTRREPYAETLFNLGHVATQLAGSWCPLADELVMNHTTFAYHAAFLHGTARARAEEMLKHTADVSVPMGISGTRSDAVVRLRVLRFCPDCRSDDLERYGETFWRVVHQLPGVPICLEHRTMLHGTTVPVRVTGLRFMDANDFKADRSKANGVCLDAASAELVHEIATRCVGYLNSGRQKSLCPIDYREAAAAAGFRRRVNMLDIPECVSQFQRFFGPDALAALNGADRHRIWLCRAFSRLSLSTHAHAMLGLFFEQSQGKTEARQVSQDIRQLPKDMLLWCPNPHATHTTRTVRVTRRLLLTNGTGYVWGACTCGFQFSFRHVEVGGKPVVLKVRLFGSAWRAARQKLVDSGLDGRAITRALGLNHRRYKRLTRECVEYASYHEKLEGAKQAWLAMRRAGAHRRGSPSKKSYGTLTAWLTRNDKQWVASAIRDDRRRHVDPEKGHERPNSYWESRDKRLLVQLRDAVERLRSEPDGLRLTKTRINAAAGIEVRDARLPESLAFIERHTESKVDYVLRRATSAAARLAENGEALTMKNMKREAGMNMTTEVRRLISDYLISRQTDFRARSAKH